MEEEFTHSATIIEYPFDRFYMEKRDRHLYTYYRPLNLNKNPIPFNKELRLAEEDLPLESNISFEKIQFKSGLINSDDKKTEYSCSEDAEIESYLLIMAIRKSVTSLTNLVSHFRDDSEHDYPLIQSLLYCGLHCSQNSIVSFEAFQVLDIIFNGSKRLSINPWKITEREKNELKFYSEYADIMVYDSSEFTQKMFHSLPVFWSHRYNLEEYNLSEEEKEIINTDDYYEDDKTQTRKREKNKKNTRKREKGETALEILQPLILFEPPISSNLTCTCLNIFTQLLRKRNSVINKNEMVEIDGIILDFYQHHFAFGPGFEDVTLSSLLSSNTILPLKPSDNTYNHKRGHVLNGFLIEFLLNMASVDNKFFFIRNNLTKMGQRACFRNVNASYLFEYKDFFKFGDLASGKDINPEDSPLSFTNNDGHSIIVDEFPMIIPTTTEEDKKVIPSNTKEVSLSKSTRKISRFKPTVMPITTEKESKKSSNQSSELENKNKKIKQFEDILMIQTSKKEDNIFIDEDEENEFFTKPVMIGEGGQSVTYKVIDKRTKIPMCKKVLKYRKGQTSFKDAQNALKEFDILRLVSHPCICKAIAINTSEKMVKTKKEEEEEKDDDEDEKEMTTIALFLEYVDYNLSDFLASKIINNTSKSLIVLDVVHAMNFLHKKGMMHRDLKIENIMLNALFETKIVDFGFASISEAAIEGFSYAHDSLTKGIGTLAYMSPEMANEEDYDNKTDVYSFGVVLHVMFTGKLPKQSLKEKMTGQSIKFPKPSSSISKFCIKLIEQCMSYDAAKRPSFEEILNQLRSNSYELAAGVNPSILSRRDKELDFIENYK